jgi:hypothetical protein
MQFDVKTLYLLNIVVVSVTAAVSFFSWFRHRDILGLRGWAIGLSLGAVGLLMLAMRTPTSPAILIAFGNTLIVAGYATVWMSMRQFNDGGLDIRCIVLPVGLFGLIFGAALLAGADVRMRVVLVSIAIGCLSSLAAWEVSHGGKREPLRSRLLTASGFLLIAIAMSVRIGFSLFAVPPTTGAEFYDPTQGSALFINTLCLVAVTFGFLMMVNERLRQRYEKLASTDELTGLPNRRFFLENGQRLAARPLAMDHRSAS